MGYLAAVYKNQTDGIRHLEEEIALSPEPKDEKYKHACGVSPEDTPYICVKTHKKIKS